MSAKENEKMLELPSKSTTIILIVPLILSIETNNSTYDNHGERYKKGVVPVREILLLVVYVERQKDLTGEIARILLVCVLQREQP